MSPSSPRRPPADSAAKAAARLNLLTGERFREERLRRRWTLRDLAAHAGLSTAGTQAIEAGRAGSVDAWARLADALGLRLEIDLVDPRRKRVPGRQVDLVHAAMGELEARHFRSLGFPVALDEPYQHYQFAGRADFLAWDLQTRALLHIENRTRFPDFQDMAGAFNAKRAYLGTVVAARLGIDGWQSEAHVIVALWTAEVLHSLRMQRESFRALAGAKPEAFEAWWAGGQPAPGKSSALVVLDALAQGRQRPWIGLEEAMSTRPRQRDYAEVARLLTRGA